MRLRSELLPSLDTGMGKMRPSSRGSYSKLTQYEPESACGQEAMGVRNKPLLLEALGSWGLSVIAALPREVD